MPFFREFILFVLVSNVFALANSPRSIYSNSYMTASRSDHLSIFGLGTARQWSRELPDNGVVKMCNFDPKASESCENLNISNVGY